MKLLFSFLISLAVAGSCLGVNIPDHAYTQRAPSYPLAVRTPYASIWLPHNTLPGNWPAFWTGTVKGALGVVRVDGVSYEWMGAAHQKGDAAPVKNVASQKAAIVTPTQTHFILTAGPVDVNVTFFSPVEYEDVQRQSIPLSHISVTVGPNDGRSHEVQVYVDISGEWASSDLSVPVKWSIDTTSATGLQTWSTELVNQYKFGEYEDFAQWGQSVFTTTTDATFLSGKDDDVRSQFVNSGRLTNQNDERFRCASCDWPVFGFAHNLTTIAAGASKTVRYVWGHLREENINLLNQPQKALWTHYWPNRADMFSFFWGDFDGSLQRANALDVKLLNDAFASEGQEHANVVAMSLRQAYAGTEFSGNITYPILYMKEISSNGNMQTVDVMYPAVPMHYHLNVRYLRYLLRPLFYQMENGFWTQPFSIHDIGWHYPNATGHSDLVEEDMPVEESANMLLMVASIALHPEANVTESADYVNRHYPILTQWAKFLFDNCLYPTNQLTTDDFIGNTQLNSGLALKGILGMKAFARLANLSGHSDDSTVYNNAVASYIQTWEVESSDPSGVHLKMEYNVTGGFQFKYNALFDKLLSFNVVPDRVYQMEAAYYLTKEEPYGIPFCDWHDYTKSDWEMWTAAAFGDASPTIRTNLIAALSRYLRFTASRVPFSDWYTTATANSVGFRARPVAGGHFAVLALNNRARP